MIAENGDITESEQIHAGRLLAWGWIGGAGFPPSPLEFLDPNGFPARVAAATRQYLEILARQAKPIPSQEDVMVSALLGRLLAGRQPLPDPPPLSDGMPWYSIIEEMGPLRCRLEETEDVHEVRVNGTAWTLEGRDGLAVLLRWKSGSPLFRAWPDHEDCLPTAWWIAADKTGHAGAP